jgi:Protein of unknown function (DUF642)
MKMRKLLLCFLAVLPILTQGQTPGCPNNLIVNGSFNSVEGMTITAPGWVGYLTPDINDENGPLNTTPGYTWTGTPLASSDDSTWQNLFGGESIEQTVTVTPGQAYTLCFEYAAQGISIGSSNNFSNPAGVAVAINNMQAFTTPHDSSQFTWETACFTFTPNTSTVNVAFTPTTTQYIGIDGVCLTSNVASGISEANFNSLLMISQNPFSTQTVLQFKEDVSNGTLSIENSIGQTVIQIKNISGKEYTLYRNNLPAGLYFLRFTQDNKVVDTKRVLVLD